LKIGLVCCAPGQTYTTELKSIRPTGFEAKANLMIIVYHRQPR
jgi:hypothetical protein